MSDSQIKSVLLVIAMEQEAQPQVDILGLQQQQEKWLEPTPIKYFMGQYKGIKVHLMTNGKSQQHGVDNVGTVPAGLTTYVGLMNLQVDLVVSAGTAGGFGAMGASIGDVFLSTSFQNHDRRIPLPGFDKYGIGHTKAHPCPNMVKSLGLKEGIVSSSNSLDYTDKCMELMRQGATAVKEMEAAAIAWICGMFNKPLIALKSITDIVDGSRPAQEEFMENLQSASEALKDVVHQAIEFVAGKRLSQL
eukprot:TRINITY_DN7247_c0_g1_i2.p1 TRINITY_DN7247_c0_g1~~TRINITY_DN7247_c0_g1_i2.p1  ORF type:complete len:247 (+),score=51.12 TRINITY_DN7247_c0_g1_i2:277-1017(+)